MHHHKPLIHQLGLTLGSELKGFVLYDAFSINKNELILVFNNIDKWISLKLIIEARTFFFQFYNYPIERKGSAYLLFSNLKNGAFKEVFIHDNERSFRLVFNDNRSLVFKLYGSLANVFYFDNETLSSLFRPQIESDKNLPYAHFLALENSNTNLNLANNFYVYDDENNYPVLDLKDNHSLNIKSFNSLFEAYNEFTKQYLGKFFYTQKRNQLIQKFESELKRWKPVEANATKAMLHLESNVRNEEIGHIIMANLHEIEKGNEVLITTDFYTNNKIEIKLKTNLNPQENAEYYYKKARSKKKELQLLKDKIAQASDKVKINESNLALVLAANSMRDLKQFDIPINKQNNKIEKHDQFKKFEWKGYKIFVGKSASNNDYLTLKIAHKNDMWLHAKGVSGSHVIIKHLNSLIFTKESIIFAAQLAAYYSKSKGSTLVPVIYTLKKFVRKPKGAEPGQVFVEKEDIILVAPKIDL